MQSTNVILQASLIVKLDQFGKIDSSVKPDATKRHPKISTKANLSRAHPDNGPESYA